MFLFLTAVAFWNSGKSRQAQSACRLVGRPASLSGICWAGLNDGLPQKRRTIGELGAGRIHKFQLPVAS